MYTRGTTRSHLVATDHGVVATLNSGTTDLGEPINFRMRTKWYEWEGIENKKIINSVIAVCEKAHGLELRYQTDEKYAWETIGEFKRMINSFDKLSVPFHRIRFQVAGTSRKEAAIFKAILVTEGINEGVVRYA